MDAVDDRDAGVAVVGERVRLDRLSGGPVGGTVTGRTFAWIYVHIDGEPLKRVHAFGTHTGIERGFRRWNIDAMSICNRDWARMMGRAA